MSDEHYQVLNNIEQQGRRRENLTELWQNNEVFREEVKAVVKCKREYSSAFTNFAKETAVLKREWAEATLASKSYLQEQRRIFSKRYTKLPSYSKVRYGTNKIKKMLHKLSNTYDLGWRSLDALADIPGAPKINLKSYRRFRYGIYLFRIRI